MHDDVIKPLKHVFSGFIYVNLCIQRDITIQIGHHINSMPTYTVQLSIDMGIRNKKLKNIMISDISKGGKKQTII